MSYPTSKKPVITKCKPGRPFPTLTQAIQATSPEINVLWLKLGDNVWKENLHQNNKIRIWKDLFVSIAHMSHAQIVCLYNKVSLDKT